MEKSHIGSPKSLLAKVFLVAMGIGLGLLVLEIGLRLVPHPAAQPFTRGTFVPDRDADYDLAANFPHTPSLLGDSRNTVDFWTNELGCFDEPFKGGPHILVLGDSFTQSGYALKDMWGSYVQTYCGQRVLKCGVSGYGTKQEFFKARKIIKRTGAPKLIIVARCVNDLNDDYLLPSRAVINGWTIQRKHIIDYETGACYVKTNANIIRELALLQGGVTEGTECPSNSAWQLLKCWLYRNSRVYHRLKQPLKDLLGRIPIVIRFLNQSHIAAPEPRLLVECPHDLSWIQEVWKSHVQNFKDLQALAAQQHAELLVVLIPTRDQVYPFIEEPRLTQDKIKNTNEARDLMIRFLAHERINYLDLQEPFRQYANLTPRKSLDSSKDLYLGNDQHWSLLGQHLAGMLVARHVLRRGLLRLPDLPKRQQDLDRALEDFRKTSPR